jgi:hypothetical protein
MMLRYATEAGVDVQEQRKKWWIPARSPFARTRAVSSTPEPRIARAIPCSVELLLYGRMHKVGPAYRQFSKVVAVRQLA